MGNFFVIGNGSHSAITKHLRPTNLWSTEPYDFVGTFDLHSNPPHIVNRNVCKLTLINFPWSMWKVVLVMWSYPVWLFFWLLSLACVFSYPSMSDQDYLKQSRLRKTLISFNFWEGLILVEKGKVIDLCSVCSFHRFNWKLLLVQFVYLKNAAHPNDCYTNDYLTNKVFHEKIHLYSLCMFFKAV